MAYPTGKNKFNEEIIKTMTRHNAWSSFINLGYAQIKVICLVH